MLNYCVYNIWIEQYNLVDEDILIFYSLWQKAQ